MAGEQYEFPRDLLVAALRDLKAAWCTPDKLSEIAAAAGMHATDLRLFTSSDNRIGELATRLAAPERLPDVLELARAYVRHAPDTAQASELQAWLEELSAARQVTTDGPVEPDL